jgi:hypothetical protein
MKIEKSFLLAPIWLLILMAVSPAPVLTQDQSAAAQFQQEELDQLLAPIALYPDSLLGQILMAATYPLEVAQAEQWAKANRSLGPDRFNDALDQKNWDPSVKALVPFPQVLSMMSDNLEWTQNLGDAFLIQQDEIMDTVQDLRSKAEAAGNLKDTQEQKVIMDGDDIEIEPADQEEVYVPVYDPAVIYGPWWDPDFPPLYFPPPAWIVIAFRGGIGFGKSIAVSRAWEHGWGRWDWRNHHIHVNIDRNININRNISTNIQTTPWQHDPSHRKGVSYGNTATRQRYGQSVRGAENRRDFRGFETRTQQAPAALRPTIPQTRSRQSPTVSQQGLDRGKDRSAFGSIDHGSAVQRQSNRGNQSRQSIPSRGTGTVNHRNSNAGGRR